MNDEEEIAGKTSGLMPELFYDVIGRVIPGAIIIGLYGSSYISESPSNIALLGYIVVAYVLGLAMDVCIGILFDRLPYFNNQKLMNNIRKQSLYNRSVAVKMLGELLLFRSCAVLGIITLIFSPKLEPDNPFLECSLIYSIAAVIACMCGYYQINKNLKSWLLID